MHGRQIWHDAATLSDASAWVMVGGCVVSLVLSVAAFCGAAGGFGWAPACAVAAVRAVVLPCAGGLLWDLWARRRDG